MKKFSSFLFLLTLVALSFGQSRSDKPNLSGTWQMTESKNMATHDPAGYSKTLVIVHHEPQIKMTTQLGENGQLRTLDTTYFTDGRGETNRNFGDQMVKTMTKWDGNKLEVHQSETTSVREPDGRIKTFKLEFIEKWELSKDAKTLTKTSSAKGPPGVRLVNDRGPGPPKEVFARKE